jgi:hypothetical protein
MLLHQETTQQGGSVMGADECKGWLAFSAQASWMSAH